jgi:hypothetical protein
MGGGKIQYAILFFLIFSFGTTTFLILQNREVMVAYRERELNMVTELLASDHEAAIGGIRQFLVTLAYNLDGENLSSDKCAEILNKISITYPYFLNLGIADTNGIIKCSGTPFPNGVAFTDEEAFNKLLSTQHFTASGYQISKSTGKPSVKFYQPIFNDKNELLGAVFTSFGTEWLNGFSPSFQFSDNIVVTKFDQDGNVFMRYPNPALWSGTDQSESELFKTIKEYGEGTAVIKGLAGKRRLYHFRPIYLDGELNAYVAAGI